MILASKIFENMGTSIGRKALLWVGSGFVQCNSSRSCCRCIKQCQIRCWTKSFTATASILIVVSMPVPWEALIPFGQPVLPCPVESSAEFTRSGHRNVRCRWNVVERIQTRTKPGQGESSILLSPVFIHLHFLIPASEISYRLVGGNDDGQRPATHWSCTETDGTCPTFLPSLRC